MKPFAIAITAVWLLLGFNSARAAEKLVTLAVDHMTCASCPYIVRESLAAAPGVKAVAVTFETQSAVVLYEDTITSPETFMKITTDAGYPSRVVP
jgi:mercuric ion binding protein